MIHYCKQCGTLLEEAAKVCPFCGCACEDETPQSTPAEISDEIPAAAPKKRSSKVFLIAAVILLGAIIIATAVYLVFFNPATTINQHYSVAAVDHYYSVVLDNIDQVGSLAPNEYWTLYASRIEYTPEKYIESEIRTAENRLSRWTAHNQDYYGEDFSLQYKVIDQELFTEQEVEKIAGILETDFGIKKYQVTSAYHLFIKITTEGTEYKNTYVRPVCAVQIRSEWYLVVYMDNNDGTGVVDFLTGSRISYLLN